MSPAEMSPAEVTPAESKPLDTVRSYLGSFATGDPAEIAAHVSDGFINEHTSILGSGCIGRAAYLERLPNFLADMVDLEYAIEDLIANGDRVAAFYTMTAKWQGAAAISIRGVQRLVVADGLITHRTDYWDSGTFLDQTTVNQTTVEPPS